MYGLMLRLSTLDADAASALRVIGFFDALVEQRADLPTVLRRTAQLVEAPVGVRTSDHLVSERAEPGGRMGAGGPYVGARLHRLSTGDEVWLEREGEPLPLDDLVMERFALAVTVALGRRERDLGQLDGPELIQQAIRPGLSDSDRRRVVGHLGLDPAAPIHVLAAVAPMADIASLAENLGRLTGRVRFGEVGACVAVLSSGPVDDTVAIPVGCRCGTAVAADAAALPVAWHQARVALRLALPSQHASPPYAVQEAVAVPFHIMGGFAAVVEHVPIEAIDKVVDVQALDRLAAEPGGADMIRTLEAVAATESLRRAASMLHLHHNSVAHRVSRAEQVLGFAVTDSYAHSRLMLALVLQRARDSAARD